jgi:hypothetical protein
MCCVRVRIILKWKSREQALVHNKKDFSVTDLFDARGEAVPVLYVLAICQDNIKVAVTRIRTIAQHAERLSSDDKLQVVLVSCCDDVWGNGDVT